MPYTLPWHFDVTIPAGTAKASPLVTLCQFEQGEVERIEWVFPPGCQGQVGIQIGARAVPIYPRPSTAFIIRSGGTGGHAVTEAPNTGDWSVIGYNTGAFNHTLQVTFFTHRIESPPELDRMFTDLDRLAGIGES